MTERKVVSAEIPLHFILCPGSQFIPGNMQASFSSLLRAPFSFGKGTGGKKKNELGDPWLTWLGNFFFSWSPVKREQEKKNRKKKKKHIANSAHSFISKGLKILWNYWAENHSYNKVEMIPSDKTGQLYHYCCWAESSERPLHHQLSNYKDSNCTPCNNYP